MSPARERRPSRLARAALARAVLVAVGATALGAAPRAALADKVHENEALNYELHLPDSWVWPPPETRKDDVVEVAERRFLTLADGKTEGRGRGGRLFLAVADPPKELPLDYEDAVADWQQARVQWKQFDGAEGKGVDEQRDALKAKMEGLEQRIEKDLGALAGLPAVQRLLLVRFDEDPAKAPPVRVDATALISDDQAGLAVPAAQLDASGTARNLLGEPMPCEARMFVFVVRKKMYRLAIWIWPSEADAAAKPPRRAAAAHLRDDVDEVGLFYVIPKKEAIRKKPEAVADGAGDVAEEKPVGDSAEETVVPNLAEGWKVTKPKGFATTTPDRTTAGNKNVAFRMEAQHKSGALAAVDLFVYAVDDAAQAPPTPQTRLPDEWRSFVATHKEGKLLTAAFPRAGYLVLPDLGKAKEVDRPSPTEKNSASLSDLEKWGVVEESKNVKFGKTKVRGPYRMCLKGSLERVGADTQFQWMFSTPKRTFLIRITAYKDALDLWKDPIKKFLDDFTLIED